MAEKIVSPGVFTNEVDQSFLPAAIADIGAALIGPTVKGPALVPTIVTSYSEFQQVFGDVFLSGSDSYQYLTSHTAEQYLKNSNTLTVVRILAGDYGHASASVNVQTPGTVGSTPASGSIAFDAGGAFDGTEIIMGGVDFHFVRDASNFRDDETATSIFVSSGSTTIATTQEFVNTFNASQSLHGLNFSASAAGGTTASFMSTTSGSGLNLTFAGGTFTTSSGTTAFGELIDIQGGGAASPNTSFTLRTHAEGSILNNVSDDTKTNHILLSGSVHNIRYEIPTVNNSKGTFTLQIRRGDDSVKRKQVLETFSNLSLDPKSTDFISKRVGDQVQTVQTDENGKPFLQLSGSYQNRSKYVRVEVPGANLTPDYLDENGNVRLAVFSGSLPASGSGSLHGGFGGGTDGLSGFDAGGVQKGTLSAAVNFYETIDSQTQGFTPSSLTDVNGGKSYAQALDLLSNQDEYDINLILAPGIIDSKHTTIATKIVDVCEDRGDCFAIIDPVTYGQNVVDATTRAEAKDSNYAAMYWPWVQVPDSQVTGKNRWVPPSVVMGGIYAFNDKVAHPWFAPAGLNRGGIDIAVRAERKLTQSDRDTLYDSNVNPIATFPGQGVTVFGQKTLQKKASALDRINVRRLLIKVKKFIASSSRFLLFEQNTAATRRRFLGIVNPYLENVQSQSGLNAFRVVMDETNNTPDTIDRNQLVGQLFLQPTRTAEFIVLDFTIQPTGAAFPE